MTFNEIDVAVSSITFLTLREKLLVRKNIDNLSILALHSIEDISQIIRRTIKVRGLWDAKRICKEAEVAVQLMESRNIGCMIYGSDEYPSLLSEISEPPYALFYRGNPEILKKECVSIVGTRRCIPVTSSAAFDFARDGALEGNCIVSGLAFGIDAWAHKGALASKVSGSTAAVLPCGIETVVPMSNSQIARNILDTNGVLVSEYMPGVPAQSFRFVQRNRIIAGLSSGVCVIHSPEGGGALITADFALDYNRDLTFHSAGFSDQAKQMNEALKKNEQKTGRYSSEHYVAEGAPVVSSFAEYKEAVSEAPGTCSQRQGLLDFNRG